MQSPQSVATRQINLEKKVFNDSQILITSDHTTFCNSYNAASKQDNSYENLLSTYRNLVNDAKMAGATIKYKHKTFSRIKELESDIKSDLATVDKLFKELSEKWLKKLETGVFAPTIYDEELQEMARLENKISTFYWRSSPIGSMLQLLSDLKKRGQNLSPNKTIYL